MLELVFVIVVVGILAAVMIPRIGSSSLREAAEQVVSHIRYTQHLAMVDDKFDTNRVDSAGNQKWFKERWQIFFSNGENTFNQWSYTIFSDRLGNSTGNPDPEEVAVNPLNNTKRLTGGANGAALIHSGDDEATHEMNLGDNYGIIGVAFSGSCSLAGSQRIAFDNLGRPLRGAFHNYTSAYHAADRLITAQCRITLSDNNENIVIAIEPESGYAHIL
ncbi:MAG: type II secretion system GspH family protein [Sulfurimonas sp.]|nr:type II secretion system GspH family protein [Sulfurimonas sp.]